MPQRIDTPGQQKQSASLAPSSVAIRLRSPICRLAIVCAAALLIAFAPVAGAADQRMSASQLVARDGVLVIAHRGDSHAFPENTLPAFESAVSVGSDLVELDYHHSADGVPVAIHDGTLDRTTDARQRWMVQGVAVCKESYERIAELDAGTWLSESFAGTKVPRLDESLDVIQQGSMTLIERKAGDAETCVSLLRQKNLIDSVVVQSFDWNFVAACHRLEPRLILGALGGHDLTPKRLDAIEATGAKLVVWHHKSLDAASIRAIHDRGLRAWAFTVDDPARVELLIKDGLDGIITNVPATMIALVERLDRGMTAASGAAEPTTGGCTSVENGAWAVDSCGRRYCEQRPGRRWRRTGRRCR